MVDNHSPAPQPPDAEPDAEPNQGQELRILDVLSSLSYRAGELKPYLQAIAQAVGDLIHVDLTVITLCRDDAETILASTVDPEEEIDQTYELHGTLTAIVVETGTSLVVEDTAQSTAYGEPPEGYQAYLGVPLRIPTGEVLGAICSFQEQPRKFEPDDVRLVEVFAERAATAIDNFQLYQQQQQFNQALEAEVARRTEELQLVQARLLEANTQLEQRIEQRTAELRQANEQLQAEVRERQQVEEALRESEMRFRLLVENAGDAFLLLDATNGQILDANQQACKNLGYTYEELLALGTPDMDVRYTPEELQAFRQRLMIGQPTILESEHRRKDGTTFPVEATVCLFESGGRLLELALVRDITERKQAEQATARLAEIGELATMIVHEVRNPLTTVMMGLTALQGANLSESLQARLALATDDAERLQRLLNEILMYARQPVLQSFNLDLNQLMNEFINSLQTVPAIAGHVIELIPSSSPAWVMGDRDKLKQVFINLIRNACEAVNRGEMITCHIDVTTNQVCVSIRNPGEPIPPDQLARLGTPFFTTKLAGNGLGLAIVRRIMEAHGGTLQIGSTHETGTTVSVRFPRINPPSEDQMYKPIG